MKVGAEGNKQVNIRVQGFRKNQKNLASNSEEEIQSSEEDENSVKSEDN